ncbi:hypothetical protein L1987_80817 [Smallanthus sonchifolius]|uniref:Uncharacterized protein n=1 Tax=Smallanthus sonchifolius TaxID=185202 RepID=A0ACB8YNT2_9ASTR|nr:hypothetical protein L1987_80817 [Smallanthus sonchifolius]
MASTFGCLLLFTLIVKGYFLFYYKLFYDVYVALIDSNFGHVGYAQCELKEITVETERTSRQVEGFQSVERVYPDVLASVGNNSCIVNRGRPIGGSESIEFLYAWDPPFIFVPISSKVECG